MPGRGVSKAEEGRLGCCLWLTGERPSQQPWYFIIDTRTLCPLMGTETPVSVCSTQVCAETQQKHRSHMDMLVHPNIVSFKHRTPKGKHMFLPRCEIIPGVTGAHSVCEFTDKGETTRDI